MNLISGVAVCESTINPTPVFLEIRVTTHPFTTHPSIVLYNIFVSARHLCVITVSRRKSHLRRIIPSESQIIASRREPCNYFPILEKKCDPRLRFVKLSSPDDNVGMADVQTPFESSRFTNRNWHLWGSSNSFRLSIRRPLHCGVIWKREVISNLYISTWSSYSLAFNTFWWAFAIKLILWKYIEVSKVSDYRYYAVCKVVGGPFDTEVRMLFKMTLWNRTNQMKSEIVWDRIKFKHRWNVQYC